MKSQFGYHIIQLISHEEPRLKPFEEVKPQLAAEFQKERANDLMQKTADKVEAALAKDPQHPEKVATDLGVQYVKADNVAPGVPLPVIGVNREFNESVAVLKKGEVSQPVAVVGNKIAMAVCTDIIPAHPAAFEDVESKVRDAVTKEKLNHLVEQKANQLAEKAKANGGDLDAAAKSMGLEVKTSAPVDRAGSIEGLGSASMLTDTFTKPAGSIFGPDSIPGAQLVGKVLEHVPADMTGLAAQRTAIRDELKNRMTQARSSLFEEGVRDTLQKKAQDPRFTRKYLTGCSPVIRAERMIHAILDLLRSLTTPERLIQYQHDEGWLGYAVLFILVFAETGALVGFFLPGDSLLFTVGVVCGAGDLNIVLVNVLLMCAALLGDTSGYLLGRSTGPHIFNRSEFARSSAAST